MNAKHIVDGELFLINPLPATLAHYQDELLSVLSHAGTDVSVTTVSEVGDRLQSRFQKLIAAFSIVKSRLFRYRRNTRSTLLVVWPLFGYLDILTWIPASRSNKVVVIYHDPTPLRRQIGVSRLSRLLFSFVTKASSIEILCHTELAKNILRAETGIEALLAPHPMKLVTAAPRPRVGEEGPKLLTVLGQYKSARSIEPLVEIAKKFRSGYTLQVVGKGWPAIDGWTTDDRFVTEQQFQRAIDDAHCVVIPYSHFFQSGVAVRCLESMTPVVAPRHEHIEGLYGTNWPGLVDEGKGWVQAVNAVCHKPLDLTVIADERFVAICRDWKKFITQLSEVK